MTHAAGLVAVGVAAGLVAVGVVVGDVVDLGAEAVSDDVALVDDIVAPSPTDQHGPC